jgi:peptidoglycan/xylan/chitin deacetylase (PgdA/CDA1 family)
MAADGVRGQVAVSVNLDAETLWLGLFAESVRMPKTLSMGEYGPRHGLQRVLYALARHDVRATFFIPGRVAELYPDEVRAIRDAGHEIGLRGYQGESLGQMPEAAQAQCLTRALDALGHVTKERPAGFRAPLGEVSLTTLRLVQDEGFLYSSSLHGDDRPYRLASGLLELPWHWELYDLPYFVFNYNPALPQGQGRIAPYRGVLQNWLDELQAYRREGLFYQLVVTPQAIGTPGRIPLFEAMLDAMGHAGVQTLGEIARRS